MFIVKINKIKLYVFKISVLNFNSNIETWPKKIICTENRIINNRILKDDLSLIAAEINKFLITSIPTRLYINVSLGRIIRMAYKSWNILFYDCQIKSFG